MDIRLQKVINFFKEDAPTMSMSGGGIAGSAEAGDDPPVRKKKKKKRKRHQLVGMDHVDSGCKT